MALSWFLCPYKRRVNSHKLVRYCAMDDFTELIAADAGAWSEIEVLGDRAIVKVRATPATLATIAGTATFRRIPLTLMDDPLSSLTAGQRTAVRNELLDAGYSLAEVTAAFPDIAQATLGQVLRFLCTRRLKPRYDANTDTIIFDGDVQACGNVDQLNRQVK